MAGVNTFKGGLHRSRLGRNVPDVLFTIEEWAELEAIANYQFNDKFRDNICHELALIKEGNKWSSDAPKRQDIKRTLTAITKLEPDKALLAEQNCDQFTIALLDEVTWENNKKFAYQVSGEEIILAAKTALQNLPESSGGRPSKTYLNELAKYSVKVWLETGNPNITAYVNEDSEKTSPLVKFASMLFKKVKNVNHDDYDIAKRLRRSFPKR